MGKKKKVIYIIKRMFPLFLLLGLFAGMCLPALSENRSAFAAAEGETEEGKTAEGQDAEDKTAEGEDAEQTPEIVIRPMTGAEKFRLFLCCVFGVGVCLVAALWGDPRERLKDKYKRARKQQALEEKKRKEREERLAKKAAEDKEEK